MYMHAMLNYCSYHWRIGAICISLRIMGSINLPRLSTFTIKAFFCYSILLLAHHILTEVDREPIMRPLSNFGMRLCGHIPLTVHAIYNIHTWSKNFLSPSLLRSSACWNSITLQQLVRWLAITPHQNRFK